MFDKILGRLREKDAGGGGGGGSGGPAVLAEYSNSGVPVAGVVKSIALSSATTFNKFVVSIGGALPIGGNFEADVRLNGVSILSGNLVVTTTETVANGRATVITGDVGKAAIATASGAAEDEVTLHIIHGSGNSLLGSDVYMALFATTA